jgi:signal peptidase I
MNFALLLFLLTVVTGFAWLLDRLVLVGRRRARARAAVANFDRQRLAGATGGGAGGSSQREEVELAALREPSWIEYSKAFFPVLLIVFLLRSFVAEPFKIPSSSMRPTLVVGDFILVNKFIYGIRLPILEKKILPWSDPQRGDVVVFRYPVNPSQDFIKRVIGTGGDVVEYRDKKLTVNGQPWPQRADGSYSYLEGLRFDTLERFFEQTDAAAGAGEPTGGIHPQAPPLYGPNVRNFPGRENCDYNDRGFICKVPAGHYLTMGDNRDNSDDSRYWGFVPDDHIRGKAFFIWFNWDDIASFAWKRVGSGIR